MQNYEDFMQTLLTFADNIDYQQICRNDDFIETLIDYNENTADFISRFVNSEYGNVSENTKKIFTVLVELYPLCQEILTELLKKYKEKDKKLFMELAKMQKYIPVAISEVDERTKKSTTSMTQLKLREINEEKERQQQEIGVLEKEKDNLLIKQRNQNEEFKAKLEEFRKLENELTDLEKLYSDDKISELKKNRDAATKKIKENVKYNFTDLKKIITTKSGYDKDSKEYDEIATVFENHAKGLNDE